MYPQLNSHVTLKKMFSGLIVADWKWMTQEREGKVVAFVVCFLHENG